MKEYKAKRKLSHYLNPNTEKESRMKSEYVVICPNCAARNECGYPDDTSAMYCGACDTYLSVNRHSVTLAADNYSAMLEQDVSITVNDTLTIPFGSVLSFLQRNMADANHYKMAMLVTELLDTSPNGDKQMRHILDAIGLLNKLALEATLVTFYNELLDTDIIRDNDTD